MISKEDWQTAYRDALDDGRRRVDPPAPAEVEALFDGRLEGEEAERVRQRLAYYPEMARAMTTPFPESADAVLSESEIADDLAKIRERVGVPAPAPQEVVVPFRRPRRQFFAIAAGIVIALAIGSVIMQQWLREPRSVLTITIYPDATRGLSPPTPAQLSTENDYVLHAVPALAGTHREYRVELFDVTARPAEKVWTRDDVTPRSDGTLSITLPAGDLDPGLYRLVLYGVDGTDERLGTYTLRLSAR